MLKLFLSQRRGVMRSRSTVADRIRYTYIYIDLRIIIMFSYKNKLCSILCIQVRRPPCTGGWPACTAQPRAVQEIHRCRGGGRGAAGGLEPRGGGHGECNADGQKVPPSLPASSSSSSFSSSSIPSLIPQDVVSGTSQNDQDLP